MTFEQHNRRRAIRRASAVTGFLFIAIILLAPAIGGLVTQ